MGIQEEYSILLDRNDKPRQADIFEANTQRPLNVRSLTIALDTAQLVNQPFKVGFPFESVCVVSATDATTSINMRIGANDSIVDSFPLKQNFQLNLGKSTSECYLDWIAQSGKSIQLLFFVNAQLNTGSQLISISGGVTQQDGTAVSAISSVTTVGGTSIIVAPALSTRKTCMLVNNSAGTLYVGGTTAVTADATATGGIPIASGGTFVWRNPAALWGITAAAGIVNRLEEL